jgi:HlyD family secretion protein
MSSDTTAFTDTPAAPPTVARPATDGVGPDGAPDADQRRRRERRRHTARTVRRALLAAVVAAAGVGVVLALRPRPVPVDAAPVTRGPLIVAVQESGKTRVKDRYVVSAPTTGSLSRLPLDPGDTVAEGQTLGEIAPSFSPLLDPRARAQAQARLGAALSAVSQAQAQATRAASGRELAEHALARVQRMAKGGAVSAQAVEQAEFDARMRAQEEASASFATKVAAQDLRAARAALAVDLGKSSRDGHVDVIAPASGRVLRVMQKSAGIVPAGTPILEVGDPSALEVIVDLLTTAAVQVAPGTPVSIDGWGGEGTLNGRVRLVEPSGFTKPSALGVDEQRVNVVVAITDPHQRWAALGDNYRVETRLVLWRGDDVVQVPQGAIFRHGDGWAAYRVDGGRTSLVTVQVGHRGDTNVEITGGLSVGQTVIVHPGERVKDGGRVEVR